MFQLEYKLFHLIIGERASGSRGGEFVFMTPYYYGSVRRWVHGTLARSRLNRAWRQIALVHRNIADSKPIVFVPISTIGVPFRS